VSHHVSRVAAIIVGIAVALSAVVFLVFNSAFGGPQLLVGGPPSYSLTAYVADAQNLLTKSLVLDRGVQVGYVTGTTLSGEDAKVTIAVSPSETTVYRNATIEIDHRSMFGEAYVRLNPGTAGAGRLPSGSVLPNSSVLPTVGLDQMLETLDTSSRRHLSNLVRTGALIAQQHSAAKELGDTLGGLSTTLEGLQTLTGDLSGQQQQLTGLVANSTSVVNDLSTRDAEIAGLVTDGRASTAALSDEPTALQSGLEQASLLLAGARRTLAQLPPLSREALPLVEQLTAASPALTDAMLRLPSASRSLRTVVDALPAVKQSGVPVLSRLITTGKLAPPLASTLELDLRDLVPILRYTAPYGPSLVGFIASDAAFRALSPTGYDQFATPATVAKMKPFTQGGVDGAPYVWGRFFGGGLLGQLQGQQLGINPYPQPNQPNTPWSGGTYPRLEPEAPPALGG
jgi:phospholipid/cholesterol/gamma-HCH transport system substrate-binding protein